jgi:hypothetical protein
LRRGLFASLIFAVCTACGAAAAAQKVYEGSEAAALRCANIVALTAVALNDAGRLGEIEKEVMLGISFLMLESHVSGTWPQKRAALAIVRDRRDLEETLKDFELLAEECLRQFPIN